MANQRLASMSVATLLEMHKQITSLLRDRAGVLRHELASIDAHTRAGSRAELDGRSRRRGSKVQPKYRDPKTGQMWSGRGAAAGWIAAYEKNGRKREEFLIDKDQDALKRTKYTGGKKNRRKK